MIVGVGVSVGVSVGVGVRVGVSVGVGVGVSVGVGVAVAPLSSHCGDAQNIQHSLSLKAGSLLQTACDSRYARHVGFALQLTYELPGLQQSGSNTAQAGVAAIHKSSKSIHFFMVSPLGLALGSVLGTDSHSCKSWGRPSNPHRRLLSVSGSG